MKHILTCTLACALITLSTPFAGAKTAVEKRHTTKPAPVSVTAKAIEWPVVSSADKSATEHMMPEGTSPETAETPQPPPSPTLTVDINLTTQRLTVSENGQSRFTWAISSARAGYRTPTGTFTPTWMSKMWYSRQYGMAPMPHAVFFSGGVAVHATNATGMLGTPASHGCVRLAPKNATIFYAMVAKHGLDLTQIAVHGLPPSGNIASYRRAGQPRFASANGGYFTQVAYAGYGSTYGQQPPAYFAPPGQTGKKSKYTQPARATVNSFGYGLGGFQ